MARGSTKRVSTNCTVSARFADSDESSRRFRLKPATCSDGSQPVIPTKPAGVAERTASLVNGVSLR
jgi:hypothetical protein